ncbi:MAG: alpha/beta fold hydrolase [Actinomycetia bacterium]|nr:alpha/beta fold hydrolase [Actinomycetes bacterium]
MANEAAGDVPRWVDREAYPYRPKTLDHADGRMSYVDEGEGSPVLMVHGNPAWSFLYRHQIEAVSGSMRAIAPDHLGFGLSNIATRTIGPFDHSKNLERLVEHLDLDDITLVVQDWGGPIGLAFAERQRPRISKLVICNTWAWPVDRDWYYQGFSKMVGGPIGRAMIRRRNFFVESVMVKAFGDKTKLTNDIHDHYRNALDTPAKRDACARLPGAIIGATNWLREVEAGLSALSDLPVRLVWGMDDIAFREKELETFIGYFPEAEVTRLEGVGHFVQEEAPDAVTTAILAD